MEVVDYGMMRAYHCFAYGGSAGMSISATLEL